MVNFLNEMTNQITYTDLEQITGGLFDTIANSLIVNNFLLKHSNTKAQNIYFDTIINHFILLFLNR